MLSSNRKGALFMVAASLCWSLGGICIKFISWNAISIVGIRSAFAIIVFAGWRRDIKIDFTRGNILGALCLAGTILLFVFANKLTSAAAAILLQFSAPVFIILIQLIFYRKKPKIGDLLAVAAIILGMLLFFYDNLDIGSSLGNLFAIASGLSFAGVFVCNERPDTDPNQSLLLGFIINVIIGIPFAFFSVTADPVSWVAVFVLGTVQVGLAYVFFSIGIKRTPALLACLITALEPVLNPVWVALATGEIPGPFAISGGIIIIAAIIIYNSMALQKKEAEDKLINERNNMKC